MKKLSVILMMMVLMLGVIAQADLIHNGDMNTPVSPSGATHGNSKLTLDGSGNVTENGTDIGFDENEWVQTNLTRAPNWSETGGPNAGSRGCSSRSVADSESRSGSSFLEDSSPGRRTRKPTNRTRSRPTMRGLVINL